MRFPRLLFVLTCFITLIHSGLAAPPAFAQGFDLPENPLEQPDRWLGKERWSELRYGMSLRQPLNAKPDLDTSQKDSIRWAMPHGTRIRLAFARGVYETVSVNRRVVQLPARVDLLKQELYSELRVSIPGQVIDTKSDQVVEVGDLAGVISYFIIKPAEKDAQPFLYGVALLQLDEASVAVLRMECLHDQIPTAVSTFECMVNSIQIEQASVVNQRIGGWLVNAENLLGGITQDDRLKAMRGDQLFRIIEAGKDIGYVRIWQRHQDKAYYEQRKLALQARDNPGELAGIDRFELPGNAVIIQSHIRGNGIKLDHLYEAIDAASGNNAYWQIKNTLRYDNDPGNARSGTWVETGLRGTINGQDRVQIIREGTPPKGMVDFLLARERDPERRLRYPSADPRSYPSGDLVQKGWPVPKRGFVSIVDAALLPALLPREAKTYAFGAYDPESSKGDLRIMRVQPNPDGGKTVFLRPVIDNAEQVLVFDRSNNLIRHSYPDGRELRRTTRQELARVWGVQLRD